MRISSSLQAAMGSQPVAAEGQTQPQPPSEPPPPQDPGDKPSIDWKSVGKSSAIGAALWGAPAALGAIHPLAGIAGAVGVGLYAAWTTKDPRGLILGAFIGVPSAQVGMHWGALGAVGAAGLGALALGLNDYISQRRAQE